MRTVQEGKADAVSDLKIVRSRVGSDGSGSGDARVLADAAALRFTCGGGSVLEVTHVQPPGKKVMDARAFRNGLNGRALFVEGQ